MVQNSFLKMRALRSFQIIQCRRIEMVWKSRLIALGAALRVASHHSSVLLKLSPGIAKDALVQALNRSQTCCNRCVVVMVKDFGCCNKGVTYAVVVMATGS
jgi:hypothetical protein